MFSANISSTLSAANCDRQSSCDGPEGQNGDEKLPKLERRGELEV